MHIHRYERFWILVTAGLLAVFAVAIGISTLALGVEIPGVTRRVAAGEAPPDPPVRELGPGRYEVYISSRMWTFNPKEIRVPRGSTVTFHLTSEDIIHGFKILNTNVSLMAVPGQVAQATYTFDRPGEYLMLCHEYCGVGHHTMSGKLIVE